MDKYKEARGRTEEAVGMGAMANPSLLDRLKAKRANVAREYTKKIKELDRQIDLVERSDAEEIIRNAETVLYSD